MRDAFGQDKEFFAFYRSLQAYREALNGRDTSFVLSPEGNFFRFFGGWPGLRQRRSRRRRRRRGSTGGRRPGTAGGYRRAMRDLGTALALVLVIEGILYALFPDGMKRVAARAMLACRRRSLRIAGLAAACARRRARMAAAAMSRMEPSGFASTSRRNLAARRHLGRLSRRSGDGCDSGADAD